VATAVLDYSIYQYDLNQYLPAAWHELAMGTDWAAITISFLFLVFIFYIADTVLRETLIQARTTEGRYRSLFDNTNDAIFIVGTDLKFKEVNQKAADLLGYTREELVGKSMLDVVPPDERDSASRYYAQLEREGTLPLYERKLVRADGSRRLTEVSVTAVTDGQGQTLFYQSVMRDITERKRLEEQLRLSLAEMEALAMQDPLTGLLNRRAITDHAEAEWHRAQRERRPMCVTLVDLDNLKTINDTLGHQVGDQVIEQLSSTVRKTLRRYDWAGRWGGDEFMLVLPGTNLVEAQEIVERLRQHYNASELITGMKGNLDPYLSAGIACFSGRPGDEVTPTQLFGQADMALYRAKQGGKDRIEVHRDSDNS
jgi:diguanylate cyclase (GGDEF)-like protein/PAS domain S-box-containing protein